MPTSIERMIYVDDSGRSQDGLIVYGWIEFAPDHWSHVLRTWLDLRKMLWVEFRIPVTEELHTTDYVNGRGRISTRVPDRHVHEGVEYWKDFGREVAVRCLEALRGTEGLRVGAVYRTGAPANFGATKYAAYQTLIERFEEQLHESDSLALVFMDGDGRDPSYRQAHRALKLNERRVLEDAIHLDSRTSQLMQMADLVAWSAYASIDRYPDGEFAWQWYSDHLSERDPQRTPQQI
ncbi:DUF3800 domain-containing protein [Microbacterium sp. A82]|uniref:DUF3800 domain-containing protein n=1 Tax=Microbacterium sp. A82 TaxID=3450452 RepID=UPI003F389840